MPGNLLSRGNEADSWERRYKTAAMSGMSRDLQRLSDLQLSTNQYMDVRKGPKASERTTQRIRGTILKSSQENVL